MRNLYIKILSIILLITLIVAGVSISADSYNYYTYNSYSNYGNIRLLKGDNQAYLIGESNNTISIEAVYPEVYSAELTTEYNIYSYNLFGSTLVAVCPDLLNEQTLIIMYDIDTDNVTSFVIPGYTNYESTQIFLSNAYLYLTDDNGTIKQYSSYGKLINTYNTNRGFTQLFCDKANNIYSVSYDGVYSLNNGSFSYIYKGYLDAPLQAVGDDMFVNTVGNYYKISNKSVSYITDTENTTYYPSGGIISNHAITSDDKTLYAVDISKKKADRFIDLPTYIEEFCVVSSNIITLTFEDGNPIVSVIPYNEMIKKEQEENISISSDNKDSQSSDSIPTVKSNIYNIDNKRNVILDIPCNTTVAQFKKNVSYDGFNIKFTKYDGKEIKSGNVGTATIVEFYNDYYSIEYELSVIGDLTGEGNVNSRDRKTMFSYLLDEISFTGVYINSADIDKSNKIDIVDLVLILRMIDNNG